MPSKIKFLTLTMVLQIHKKIIDLFGGSHGLRDIKLIDSAVNQPKIMFQGKYVHTSISEMAAAYAYHIIKNHAFIDGNKRTGILAATAFLDYNSYELKLRQAEFYQLAIDVACSKISKQELAQIFSKKIVKMQK